jgi:hypothetical protein
LIKELSRRLTDEFGRGFHQRNLWFMRNFYLAYPKVNALRSELSWTHYRLLLRVEKPEARAFYESEAVNSRWSTRELERQINFSWNWGKVSLLWRASNASLWMGGIFSLIHKQGN